MSLDQLLLLLSARSDGSWLQFRAAVEQFLALASREEHDAPIKDADFPIYRQLQAMFGVLAHVSFHEDNAWRIVPPSLAVSGHGQDYIEAVLCGARTPAVLERLYRHEGSAINCEATSFPDMPARIRIRAKSYSALKAVADHERLYIQDAAPVSLLLSLRAIDEIKNLPKVTAPANPGWSVSTFCLDTLTWNEYRGVRNGYQLSLLRYTKRFERTLYFLARRGSAYRVPVQIGKYLLLHARNARVLRYDEEARSLSMPITCRPPQLVERALVLCSGQLAKVNTTDRRLIYENVERKVAALAYRSLGQGAA